MHLAIWDSPPAEFMTSAMGPRSGIEVLRCDMQTCAESLMRGRVDVALLPSLVALSNTEALDILPAVALSSWKFPYARLLMREGLGQVGRVAYDPAYPQEALVARVILKEHYGTEPEFVRHPETSVEELVEADEEARLIVGNQVPLINSEDLALDLGQEWYELTNYPMVWGLFATRKDEAEAYDFKRIRETVKAAESQRGMWMQAREMPPALHGFFQDDLRVRLDDLAIASLTEFRQHLFYYNVTEEIPNIPFFYLSEEDAEDDGEQPLL